MKVTNDFLLFLLTLVCPKAPEGDDDLTPLNDDVPEELPDDDVPGDEPEELELADDEPEEKPLSRREKEIIKLRERAQEAEERERRVREEFEQARRQAQQPTQPSAERQIWEQEEAILKNPESTDWQRYAVQSARDARAAKQEAQAARLESRDAADRAKFEQLASTKPKVYEKYKDEVERTLKEMRKNGNDAPRTELLALLVGRELISGKLKSAETKPKSKVERGSTPGVRSDVRSNGRSTMSDAEKRAKRLENIRI